jgi:hypothetical protein
MQPMEGCERFGCDCPEGTECYGTAPDGGSVMGKGLCCTADVSICTCGGEVLDECEALARGHTVNGYRSALECVRAGDCFDDFDCDMPFRECIAGNCVDQ